MLKKTLAALLVLASLTSATDITFTENEPLEIDSNDANYGVYLPNTGCRAMAEFLDGDYEGDLMAVDLRHKPRDTGDNGTGTEVGSQVYFNIWNSSNDEWTTEDFTETKQPGCFLGYLASGSGIDYSQLVNASIYSSGDGVIHLGTWNGQMFYTYSRYIDNNWIGWNIEDDQNDSYWSAMYYLDQEKHRFGQVLQPTFYVNERSFSPTSIIPTFFVNGHDCEDIIFKTGFYLQTLTDPTYEGTWNDPIVISPQTFGNMGFSSVTGDTYGKLHIFWESSINTGYAHPSWHSTAVTVVQNELYYANRYNSQLSQINQLTNNYATSGGEYFVGVNLISSDVDPMGNVWALYELVTSENVIEDISIGLVKLSSNGGVIFSPGLLEDISDDSCYSPQIQIDDEGIAHFVFVIQNENDPDDKYLYYGNFDTQSLMRPVISLGDLTLVSEDIQHNQYTPGVGHLFVDSQRRIHFIWTSTVESDAPRLYYRRSETFCNANLSPERHSVSNAQATLKSGPVEFFVEDAFPNPASETISFSYSLPEALRVTIKVYDISGRLVAVPLDEIQSVGRHTFEWDVQSQGGLTNGLYLYTLKAGENVQTKRLVIGR